MKHLLIIILALSFSNLLFAKKNRKPNSVIALDNTITITTSKSELKIICENESLVKGLETALRDKGSIKKIRRENTPGGHLNYYTLIGERNKYIYNLHTKLIRNCILLTRGITP